MKFNIDEDESKKLEEWMSTKDFSKYSGAIGGRFTYSFTPTTLGTVITVTDNLDKNEIDLTSYEYW